jgi:DNA invertase Pin-like site-specific DNA recombinase
MPRGVKGSGAVNQHGYQLFDVPVPAGTLRAMTYRRRSKSGDEGEGDVSLETQDTENVKLIQGRGWVHVGDAWDLGIDGMTPHRPGYRQILKWGYEGKYDVLVVFRSDRPMRSMSAGGPLEQMLMDMRKIQIASATDHFDPSFLAISAFTNRHEYEGITVRTTNGRLTRAKRNELMAGTLPYWLGRDPDNHGILIPERVAIIAELARRYANGEPTRDLARWMRAVAPVANTHKKHDDAWSAERITNNLGHRALTGELPYSRAHYVKQRDPETTVVIRHRTWKDEEDTLIIQVPPVLHKTDTERAECEGCEMDERPSFAAVRAAIDARRTAGTGGSGRPAIHAHPLRNKVYCGVCKGMMAMQAHSMYIARSGEKRPYPVPHLYLRCLRSNGMGLQAERAQELGKHKCRTPALLRARDVYEGVLALLKRQNLAEDIEAAAERYARQAADTAETPSVMLAELRHLQERADELAVDEADLFRMRGKMSAHGHEIASQRIVQEQEQTRTRISELEKAIDEAEREARNFDVEGAAELAEKLRSVPLESLSDDEWSEIVRGLVRRVVVDENNLPSVELKLTTRDLVIAVSFCSATAVYKLTA